VVLAWVVYYESAAVEVRLFGKSDGLGSFRDTKMDDMIPGIYNGDILIHESLVEFSQGAQ
jgi:hypothetical protein